MEDLFFPCPCRPICSYTSCEPTRVFNIILNYKSSISYIALQAFFAAKGSKLMEDYASSTIRHQDNNTSPPRRR